MIHISATGIITESVLGSLDFVVSVINVDVTAAPLKDRITINKLKFISTF